MCNQNIDLFFYDAFFKNIGIGKSSPFHCHDYAEVHFTVSGRCVLYTDKEEWISEAGTVTIIPGGVIHRVKIMDLQTRHNTFLVKYSVDTVRQKTISSEILNTLLEEIEDYSNSGDFGNAAISLAYLCKDMLKPKVEPLNIENRQFIIREFFYTHYSDKTTLFDLSDELKVSPKHASRLVEKYMGMTFSKALTKHRMDAANLLLKIDGSLTLAEIASMVGYDSYSGFWKAFKKQMR